MSAAGQLDLLTPAGDAPPTWTCTTCQGEGECLRLLYPDEREPGGPFVRLGRCPTCQGEGRLGYNPDAFDTFPF